MNDEDSISDATVKISGAFVLTFADHVAFVTVRSRPFFLLLAAFYLLVFVVLWWFSMTPGEWANLRGAPLSAPRLWLLDAGPFAVGSYVVSIGLLYLFNWIAFRRIPKANRRLAIEADAEKITTRDAANASLVIPWSMVARMEYGKELLFMKLTSGGWRFAPLRAFTPEDRVRFIELVRAKARETIRASDDR